jgi:hypothetical protein
MNFDVLQLFITFALVKLNKLGGSKMLLRVVRKIVIH